MAKTKREGHKALPVDVDSPISGTFPSRERTKRRIKLKCKITKVIKETKKLNSEEFDCYFQNLWQRFSEDKRSLFTYLDSLWFYSYMTASSKGKVLKWIKRKQIFLKKFVLDICNSEGAAENKNSFFVPKEAPKDFSIMEYPYFMNQSWFSPESWERFFEELESFGK